MNNYFDIINYLPYMRTKSCDEYFVKSESLLYLIDLKKNENI